MVYEYIIPAENGKPKYPLKFDKTEKHEWTVLGGGKFIKLVTNRKHQELDGKKDVSYQKIKG